MNADGAQMNAEKTDTQIPVHKLLADLSAFICAFHLRSSAFQLE
jgi:hypothetical protein